MQIRFCFVIFLFQLSIISMAQVKFAFFAGPQFTSANYTVKSIKQPTQYKTGVMAGLGLKVPFENQLYFYQLFYYSLKGYKVTLNNPSFPPTELAKNNNTTLHTFEIAPLFQVDLSKKPSHPFVRFGIAGDIAITGREKFDTVSLNGTRGPVKRNMRFSFSEYGRYTASANAHFGYETNKGLMVFVWYAHGLISQNNADNGPRIMNRIFGLTGGWYFAQRN